MASGIVAGGVVSTVVGGLILFEQETGLVAEAVGELLATRFGVWLLRALAVAVLATATASFVALGIWVLS